jgi:DNA-binding PadR family transcriptional regulator
MIYEVLATLWEGPADDSSVARAIEERTGERFTSEAAARYLRSLRHAGYIDAHGSDLSPRYAINNDGSTLLARLARRVEEPQESLYA